MMFRAMRAAQEAWNTITTGFTAEEIALAQRLSRCTVLTGPEAATVIRDERWRGLAHLEAWVATVERGGPVVPAMQAEALARLHRER